MRRGPSRAHIAALTAGLLLAGLGTPAVAEDDHEQLVIVADARSVEETCSGAGAADFSDVGGTFEETIRCVAWLGVSEGFPDGTFRPTTVNTRGQLAAFLARTYDLVDATVAAPGAGFDPWDDEGAVFADEIDRLTALGVIDTRDDRRFRTAEPIDRGTLARWVVRLADAAEDGTVDDVLTGSDTFPDDDGHPDEAWIDTAADLGIVDGFADGTYRPGDRVTRGQMTAFVARLVDVLVAVDLVTLPAPSPTPAPVTPTPDPEPSDPPGLDPPPADGLLPADTTYALPSAPVTPVASTLFRRYDGGPTWDPCATVHVATNLSSLHPDASDDLDAALADVARHTGLRFLRIGDVPFRASTLGDTGGLPLAGYEDRQVLLITGAAAGSGGSELGRASITYRSGRNGQDATILSARIALSPDTGPGIMPAIMRHEIAHTVGLDHTDAEGQLLHPVLTPSGPRAFQVGDIAGMYEVGPGVQRCRA